MKLTERFNSRWRPVLALGASIMVLLVAGCATHGPMATVKATATTPASSQGAWRVFLIEPDKDSDLNAIGRSARDQLQRRGYEVVTSFDEKKPDAIVVYGYRTQGWQRNSTSPVQVHSYKKLVWTTGGTTSVAHYTDVRINLGFIDFEEAADVDFKISLAKRAWEGVVETRIHGDVFDLSSHVDLIVENILSEFPYGSGLPARRGLRLVREPREDSKLTSVRN